MRDMSDVLAGGILWPTTSLEPVYQARRAHDAAGSYRYNELVGERAKREWRLVYEGTSWRALATDDVARLRCAIGVLTMANKIGSADVSVRYSSMEAETQLGCRNCPCCGDGFAVQIEVVITQHQSRDLTTEVEMRHARVVGWRREG